jgi:putative transposase
VNIEGKKELLRIWIGKKEGAKFWRQVVTGLRLEKL